MMELRTLIPASGRDLETRARCQDDGHPAGGVHPWWFNGSPGTFCHCGRVVYEGVLPVVRWRPPTPNELAWEAMDAARVQPKQLDLFAVLEKAIDEESENQ